MNKSVIYKTRFDWCRSFRPQPLTKWTTSIINSIVGEYAGFPIKLIMKSPDKSTPEYGPIMTAGIEPGVIRSRHWLFNDARIAITALFSSLITLFVGVIVFVRLLGSLRLLGYGFLITRVSDVINFKATLLKQTFNFFTFLI